MEVAGALIAAYLIGSIDFAVFVGRMHGVDIREVGSGNPGTSNVLRSLGLGPAAMVFIGDALKGVVGAYLGMLASGSPTSHWMWAAGLAAVVGHCYPVFHRFKGGKGVATGFGVVLFADPALGLGLLAGWVVLAKLTRTASLASLAVVLVAIPLALWRSIVGLSLMWFALIIALVVWRHRSNIRRMAKGTEEKVPT
jgi:acyl phosphate:glycerol-3-phosphate acyltransferase